MPGASSRNPPAPRKFQLSPYARYALQRTLLLPAQLLLVLFILYMVLFVPSYLLPGGNPGIGGFWTGFFQMVTNDFTGNWGISTLYGGVPLVSLYSWAIPQSVELAAFALAFAALIAYPVSLLAGWARPSPVDGSVRLTSLFGTFLPVMIVGGLVIAGLFYWFLATFHDIPTGILPNGFWWFDQGYSFPPSWILYTQAYTQPTGFPLIDGALHGAWSFEEIVLVKTLIQAAIIAIIFVSIFLRHSFVVAREASTETHVVAARSRGIPDRTLLWRHTGRRVRSTFLLVFALALPAYLGTQFVVEAVFQDYGLGQLVLLTLTGQVPERQSVVAVLESWQVMMFLLSIIILAWLLAVDLIARRLDPRPVTGR